MKISQETIKKEQESFKTTLEQVVNKSNNSGIRAGQVEVGNISAGSIKNDVEIIFEKTMGNSEYSVSILPMGE